MCTGITALGSCLFTIMGIVAKRHGINMVGSRAEVVKNMSEKPRKISDLSVNIFINEELDDKNRLILKRAAEFCPVHNSLNENINIKINFI